MNLDQADMSDETRRAIEANAKAREADHPRGICELGKAMRELTARELLFRRAESLRQEANDLEALATAIPENYPRNAERAIRNLMKG